MTPESWNQLRYIEKVRAISKTLSTEFSSHVTYNKPYYLLLFNNLVRELPNTWSSRIQQCVEQGVSAPTKWIAALDKDSAEHNTHSIKPPVFAALRSLAVQLRTNEEELSPEEA